MLSKDGEIVTDRLDGSFNDLMNYDFTAQGVEQKLDQRWRWSKLERRTR